MKHTESDVERQINIQDIHLSALWNYFWNREGSFKELGGHIGNVNTGGMACHGASCWCQLPSLTLITYARQKDQSRRLVRTEQPSSGTAGVLCHPIIVIGKLTKWTPKVIALLYYDIQQWTEFVQIQSASTYVYILPHITLAWRIDCHLAININYWPLLNVFLC